LKILNQEDIIKFRGFEEDYRLGNFVIITEFFDSMSLDNFLLKKSTISLQNDRHILDQILTSLLYIHENSIAHGDFNLKNILISPSDNYKIKIIDFGLSKQIDFKENCEDLLTPQGNHKYRAPKSDIFQNSFACDLWGFGLVALSVLMKKKVSTKKALKILEDGETNGNNGSDDVNNAVEILKVLMKAQDYVGVRDVALMMRKLF